MLGIFQAEAKDGLHLAAILSRAAMGQMESGERRLALFDPLVYQYVRHLDLPPLGVLLEWSSRLNYSTACVSAGQDLEQLPVDPQDRDELTTVDDRPLAAGSMRQFRFGLGRSCTTPDLCNSRCRRKRPHGCRPPGINWTVWPWPWPTASKNCSRTSVD